MAGTPLQGQALIYFGPSPDRFAEVFAPIGVVLAHADILLELANAEG